MPCNCLWSVRMRATSSHKDGAISADMAITSRTVRRQGSCGCKQQQQTAIRMAWVDIPMRNTGVVGDMHMARMDCLAMTRSPSNTCAWLQMHMQAITPSHNTYMGWWYLHGECGLPRDTQQAREWMQLSAQQGYQHAIDELNDAANWK